MVDRPWSGRQSGLDDEHLFQLGDKDLQLVAHKLAKALGVFQSTSVKPLRTFGFASMVSKWIPHQPTEAQRQHCVVETVSLLLFWCTKTWLSSIVPADAKWVLPPNMQRKTLWFPLGEHPKMKAKPGLHAKNVILSIW